MSSFINRLQLKTSSILNVPLQSYFDDFSFIVNGKEYKTSRLISDLLSPKICEIHANDPTFDIFTIKTQQKGDFSHILNLTKFNQIEIPENEYSFFSEVIEILGNESIEIIEESENTDITIDNVISRIQNHEKYSKIKSKRLFEDIEFISEHFYELCEKSHEELKKLSIDTLIEIFSHPKLQLNTEDQLLKFINDVYTKSSTFSVLYEFVYFVNVSTNMIKEFISIYNEEHINNGIWLKLCERLEKEIKNEQKTMKERYTIQQKSGITIEFQNENTFAGIVSYMKKNSTTNIYDLIDITYSSNNNENSDQYHPRSMFMYEDKGKHFVTKNIKGSWICFDFKDHRVIPTDYTLRSASTYPNWYHPKSWVIEGSTDNLSWQILDDQKNCSYLNGKNLSHTFKIKNEESNEFRFIRMKSTGNDWGNANYLAIESFEIYGTLI